MSFFIIIFINYFILFFFFGKTNLAQMRAQLKDGFVGFLLLLCGVDEDCADDIGAVVAVAQTEAQNDRIKLKQKFA